MINLDHVVYHHHTSGNLINTLTLTVDAFPLPNKFKPPPTLLRTPGIAVGTGWEKGAFWGHHLVNALNGIRNVNSNVVQFSFYIRQRGVKSINDYYYYSDENELIHSIKKAKEGGMKVFLKPVVDVTDEKGEYVWRGTIPGYGKWFLQTYIPFIVKMAAIAQDHNVDIFAVGSELRDTLPRLGYWRYVIKRVRKIYSGKLTYIANHDVSFVMTCGVFKLYVRYFNVDTM